MDGPGPIDRIMLTVSSKFKILSRVKSVRGFLTKGLGSSAIAEMMPERAAFTVSGNLGINVVPPCSFMAVSH